MRETLTHPSDTHPSTDPSCEEPIPDTLRMITADDAARATLNGAVESLGRDEVRVLTRIAERLALGRRAYGLLHLATDRRTFRSKIAVARQPERPADTKVSPKLDAAEALGLS